MTHLLNHIRIICPYCKADITDGPGPCYFCESEDDDFFESEKAYKAAQDRNSEDIDPNDHAAWEFQTLHEANDPDFQAELTKFVADYEATFDSINGLVP